MGLFEAFAVFDAMGSGPSTAELIWEVYKRERPERQRREHAWQEVKRQAAAGELPKSPAK